MFEADAVENLKIEKHGLTYCTLFVVNDVKPEKNLKGRDLWSSICYILKFDNHSIIIDPGYTNIQESNTLLDKLDIHDFHIAVTHGHFDHWYAAVKLSKDRNVKIYIPYKDRLYFKSITHFANQNQELSDKLTGKEAPLKYDFIDEHDNLREFKERLRLMDNKGIIKEISYWNDGGHTSGHTCFFFNNIAFAGDIVMRRKNGRLGIEFTYGRGKEKRSERQTLTDSKRSLRKLIKEHDIEFVALGHEGLMGIDEFKKEIGKYLDI